MAEWFKYAVIAALFYGLHQVFTKLAAQKIGQGFGALVVEGTATLTIVLYVLATSGMGKWNGGVFPTISEGWAVVGGSWCPGWWNGAHGPNRNDVLP